MERVGAPPRLVKVDTQGHEGCVLAGAERVLAERTTAWFIEFWPAAMNRTEMPAAEAAKLICKYFSAYVDIRDGQKLRDISELLDAIEEIERRRFTDLLLLP